MTEVEQVLADAKQMRYDVVIAPLAQALIESQRALRDIAEGNGVPDEKLALPREAFYQWMYGYFQGLARAALLDTATPRQP